MTGKVFNITSDFEIRVDELEGVVSDIDTPDSIDQLTIQRRGKIIEIQSETSSDEISDYTPTANFKGRLDEKYPSDCCEDTVTTTSSDKGIWGGHSEEEENEELVEIAKFKGQGEEVLYNEALQYEMFKIVEEIALQAYKGCFEAIVLDNNGNLQPIKIVDGNRVDAGIKVTNKEARQNTWSQ